MRGNSRLDSALYFTCGGNSRPDSTLCFTCGGNSRPDLTLCFTCGEIVDPTQPCVLHAEETVDPTQPCVLYAARLSSNGGHGCRTVVQSVSRTWKLMTFGERKCRSFVLQWYNHGNCKINININQYSEKTITTTRTSSKQAKKSEPKQQTSVQTRVCVDSGSVRARSRPSNCGRGSRPCGHWLTAPCLGPLLCRSLPFPGALYQPRDFCVSSVDVS